jgi:hypothetical protein
VAEVNQQGSGGSVLLAGITTYVGVRPGMHLWLGLDWDVAHSTGAQFMPVRRHISFGITQQFRMHLLRLGGSMNKLAYLVLLLAPVAQAQIKHIEMRVEGMT